MTAANDDEVKGSIPLDVEENQHGFFSQGHGYEACLSAAHHHTVLITPRCGCFTALQ